MGGYSNFRRSESAQTCSLSPLLEEMGGDKNKNEDITGDTELYILFPKVAHTVCEKF
jgi:hypothetical protein